MGVGAAEGRRSCSFSQSPLANSSSLDSIFFLVYLLGKLWFSFGKKAKGNCISRIGMRQKRGRKSYGSQPLPQTRDGNVGLP